VHYVVLLRGVNVGAANQIKMPELREALEDAGFDDVRTLLRSGNVVLTDDGTAQDVERRVREVLTSRFELGADVIVRSEDELRAIVADNPLADVATDGSKQFVVFCSEPHDPARLPEIVPPEQLVTRPLELHAWCPNGLRDGKLMSALTRRQPAAATTVRNWNTVAKLAAMLDG
jgi:uncharacterized protein (DUF1697 family)